MLGAKPVTVVTTALVVPFGVPATTVPTTPVQLDAPVHSLVTTPIPLVGLVQLSVIPVVGVAVVATAVKPVTAANTGVLTGAVAKDVDLPVVAPLTVAV